MEQNKSSAKWRKTNRTGNGKKETSIPETLRIAKILKANGVSLREIQINKEFDDGERRNIVLKEIKQEGIDIQKIIEENGLDGEYKFGNGVNILRETYSIWKEIKTTKKEKQRQEARDLGLLKEDTTVTETLKIARILKANGVDLSKIQISKIVNDEKIDILLEEIEQEGIDIQKIIEENGLDGKFKYGMRVRNLRDIYTKRKND